MVSFSDNCSNSWLKELSAFTISPAADTPSFVMHIGGSGNYGNLSYWYSSVDNSVYPTLLLDSSVLAESGNGSKKTPYRLAD